jgi:hypothetical protein
MSTADGPNDVVTLIRLVPLPRAEATDAESAIVATFGRASVRIEGDSIFLVVRNESAIHRIKVGDVIQWVAEPFGAVWRTERARSCS